ncbi:MAG TPA: winged helix-turn-helix domain-containing protein, partial [Stellaceae bacterium]|nr:winged helix-turn-helix domain-containing protein [Stellaceae bacterium]
MSRSDHPGAATAVAFGPFRLFPAERLLERDGVPLAIGGRALDILTLLAERAGEVVSKRDLLARVWADVTVDEGSLRFHVAALRKALGDGQAGARYVTNVPGRGYCLVAPVSRAAPAAAERAETAAPRPASNLPPRLTRMVGREETAGKIAETLSARRFVTVVGPGGIGKTTVAVAVAHRLLADFDGGVHFLDLGALSDAGLVPSSLASALGFAVHSDDPVPSLLALLRHKRMLIVLDSCEHVVEAAASLAERIFTEAPEVHILATSRESLRVEGEQIHRLFPLAVPPEDASLAAADALGFPAVQLFIERAGASAGDFELSDPEAPLVARICQKLDGIALAIELAAGRVGAYGIEGIATLLDTRFELFWQGKRTALPRHQTLHATLDWSFELLTDAEREVLCRLGIFIGGFTLEAARAVAAGDGLDEAQVVEAIGDLVAKSLIASESGSAPMRYRLLDTTRTYVLGKSAGGERDRAIARRHALYYAQFLARLDSESAIAPQPESLGEFVRSIGNVRAALEWCFSPQGDLALGVDLAAAASQCFLEISLLTECQRWAAQAVAALDEGSRGGRREMQLQLALAVSLMFTQGNKDDVRTAFTRGIEVAEALGDLAGELGLLSGFHIYMTRIGDFRGALHIAERSEAIARRLGDPPAITIAAWLLGTAQHLIGNQADAIANLESAMQPGPTPEWGNLGRFGYDRRSIGLVALARALWLAGKPERAVAVARHTIARGQSLEHPLTLGISLVWTTYVFLWTGDWRSTEAAVEQLIAHVARHSLGPYNAIGRGLRGCLAIKRGDLAGGLELVQSCLDQLRENRHQILISTFAGDLAEGLAMTGETAGALAAIEEALDQARSAGESFNMPELLRIKGE